MNAEIEEQLKVMRSGEDTVLIMLVGHKHQGKTSIGAAAFERGIMFGRRVDQTIPSKINGFKVDHIEDVMKPYFDATREKARKRNPNWQLPSKSGYTLDVINVVLDEFAKPEWDEVRAQYDCVILDEWTGVMDETTLRYIEEADAHEKKAAKTNVLERDKLPRNRFCNNKHKKDLQGIYRVLNVAVPRLGAKLSAMDLSAMLICHTREAETKNGEYRKAHPQMPTRNIEKKAVRPAQEIYFVDQHPDYSCGFATPKKPFAPRFIAQMNHPEYECSTKAGIIPGEGPGNLWAVMQEMGVRHRRKPGRERMDAAVLYFRKKIEAEGLWDARTAAKTIYMEMKDKQIDWPYEGSKTQAIRVVYQQAYAWAWYRREADRSPFEDDSFLTPDDPPAKTISSGAEPGLSWD